MEGLPRWDIDGGRWTGLTMMALTCTDILTPSISCAKVVTNFGQTAGVDPRRPLLVSFLEVSGQKITYPKTFQTAPPPCRDSM